MDPRKPMFGTNLNAVTRIADSASAREPILAPFYSAGMSVALAHPLCWCCKGGQNGAPSASVFHTLAQWERQRQRSLFWPPP
jgi:hypothetical protein